MVAERLAEINERVAAAAHRSGRKPTAVTLVAVSKGHSMAAIAEAYEAGHRDFGENRAAELAEKAPLLPSDIRWHFVGSLQTRQVKTARPHTSLLHSLDRPRLANSWAGADAPAPALIQVNIAGEVQKHGVAPEETAALLHKASDLGISCPGLMAMAPLAAVPEESRQWFRALRMLRDDLVDTFPDLVELSMGMTDDFEVAIEEGATIIRVGRAIFGSPGRTGKSD